MGELIEYAKVSAKGGIELSIGMAISTVISALGTIVVARLLSPEDYGLYTIAMVPATMIGLFRDWGVYSAITRYISFYRAKSQEEKIRPILKAGLGFAMLSGLLSALFTLATSDLIAGFVFKKPEVASLIKISAIWVFSMALFNMGWSTLIGFEKMGQNSVVMILRSLIKSTVSPLLVLLGYGALGAVLGYGISGFLTAIICVFFFMRAYGEIGGGSQDSMRSTLALLLGYGFPLAIGRIVSGFGNQFYRFLMSRSCSPEAIGNYGAATNFLIAMTLLTSPITTALFPAFSKIDGEKEVDNLRKAFRASVKYPSIFVVPAAMGIIVTSRPLVFTLFGEKYSQAPIFLSLVSVGQLFCAIGALSAATLLTSQGKTSEIMKANLISLLIGVPASVFLIPKFGIYGLIATTLLVTFLTVALLDYMIYNIYGFSVDFRSSGRIFLASVLMASVIYLFELLFSELLPLIRILIEGVIGLLAYPVFVLLLKGVSAEDLEKLKVIFSRAGVVGRLIIWFLSEIELLNNWINRR
ncbi:MAG: hypothetical protein DRO00_05995 [Thermoproteota archaeon]|nr:MAG: hypothetical protein DRO00_05995 [Candidatus Korarchaeota archaeon]